ncbi:MAG: UvrD-helicase domain-containing protein, partial [Nitrospiraceae bacterium]
MTNQGSIPDESSRLAAATTFDRNVIVIAGAGTGKTTLLVNRLIHLIMREPDPLQMSHIVAVTFTNKAAADMRIRLREGLRNILASSQNPHVTGPSGSVHLPDLQQRYGLSASQIAARSEAALRDLERAQIGTLHSFAAHLLRLYPIEAGVDPHFQTDEDETVFESHFMKRWEKWLDQELGPTGTDHDRWRPLLKTFGLETMKNVAYALRSELFPLEELQQQLSQVTVSPLIQEWFRAKLDQADQLLRRHQQFQPKKIDSMLAVSAEIFRRLVQNGVAGLESISEAERDTIHKEVGDTVAGWDDEDFLQAKGLVRIARRALQVDRPLFDGLMTVLSPFLRELRASYRESGWMTFDGLLAKARTLVHTHPMIRARFKREYRALLVDEFQDTDPVQYEIVLFLAEQVGRHATSWRDVEPEPGKLFIVGDPKQSIYAFRRADIEAFDRVVAKLESSGALICELSTNFRSNELVLNAVNGMFDRLLRSVPNVQPSNVPLIAQLNRSTHMKQPGVEVRLVTSCQDEGETLEGAAATRLEAEQLAGWIKALLTKQPGDAETTHTDTVQPGDIAVLFRKLTQAETYLEALRRHEIPYVMDGEKHFYRRQEVIDLVNVLR